jgi:RNA polymerase sigma factor (sigma-70 family)
MDSQNFIAVLGAARVGDNRAWAQIYQEYAPAIAGYFRGRRTRDPDNLTGEVFLSIVRNLHSFSGGEREFRAWIFTVARSRLIDDHRRTLRKPEVSSKQPVPDTEAHPGAEDQALASLEAQYVREMLETLTPDQQDVLLLRLFAGLTVAEVAQLMGKDVGAIKALQRRGLGSLRKKLSEGPYPSRTRVRFTNREGSG